MIFHLAFKAIIFDKLSSLCILSSITALIAPLLILFSLRYGIVSTLEYNLINNPNNLEIKMLSGYNLDESFFKSLENDPKVSFVIPLTRSLSVTANLKSEKKVKTNVEAVPTKKGDPLVLFSDISHELKVNEAFVSASLKDDLALNVGDKIKLYISRVKNGVKQNAQITLDIAGVLSRKATSRSLIYLNLNTIIAMEDYRDGYEPEIFSDGSNPNLNRKNFARARIYASSIDDVLYLARELRENYEIRDESVAIENFKAISRVLGVIFYVIAAVSVTGGAIALSGLIFANVGRNAKSFALLRLQGFTPFKIMLLVITENLILSSLGFALACILYYLGREIFDNYFVQLTNSQAVSVLNLGHYMQGVLLISFLSIFISIISVKLRLFSKNIADTLREV